jgi:TonB family protein
MRLTALSACGLLLLSSAAWAEAPPSTPTPAQPTMSTRTATKALVSTSTTTSVGRVAGLRKEEIGAVIRRNLPRFKYCYEKRLDDHWTLSGKVVVSFAIAPSGSVTTASVAETSMNDLEVEACVVKVMRSLKFPKPRNGGVVVVTYPFVFQSK